MRKLMLLLFILAGTLLSCNISAEPIKIQLEWTAPGDDGNIGTASVYDIRYMACADTLDFDWDNANVIPSIFLPSPSPAGMQDSVLLDLGFESSTFYCFAIKTADEIHNWSNVSNIAIIETPDSVAPGTIQTLILKFK